MSSLHPSLADSEAWRRLRNLAEEGCFPQCAALCAPQNHHNFLGIAAARLLLCERGTGADGCSSCLAWVGDEHPDLLKAGSEGTPPTVAQCRELNGSMAYRPVTAARRVALVYSADTLLLPAANSLLKLAEEPPDYGFILFLLSGEDLLLPTLRSRSWMLPFRIPPEEKEERPPETEDEWMEWLARFSGAELSDLLDQFGPWTRYELQRNAFERAGSLDRLRVILETKRLSRTMALDLTVLALKEGIVFEHLFGNLW